MDVAGVDALLGAIKEKHGVDATWIESVHVRAPLRGDHVWDGEVQVFELIGHATARRAYAWSYTTDGEWRRFVSVLGVAPVVDAVTAVRAALAH